MNEIDLIEKPKELRYVSVYNQLFKMINEGNFPEGSRLPSEPELAKLIGVSRTTLRQALSLLQDDGLVNNIRGKGNFIVKSKPNNNIGLETIGHPVYKCMNAMIDDVEIKLRIEPSTDYFNQILVKKTAVVVLVDRWYKSKGKTIAYTFTLLPIETISNLNIDLNNQDEFLKLLENDIYKLCNNTLVEIKYSTAGNFAAKTDPLSDKNQFHLIQETIYNENEIPIASNKHYLPIESSCIKFHPQK